MQFLHKDLRNLFRELIHAFLLYHYVRAGNALDIIGSLDIISPVND